MNPIDDIYKPYNFSSTRCYVFELLVEKQGFLKIEHNLPTYIKQMKGVFVSTNCIDSINHLSGIISMNFNGQAFKSFQSVVYKNNHLDDCSHPNTFDETILPNSFIQGFYYDLTSTNNYPYSVKVYIHYENLEYKP